MSDVERLSAWMDAHNLSIKQFADEIGMSYDGVYQILVVRKRVGASFKWRFAQRYGWDEAAKLFDTTDIPILQVETDADSTPTPA